MHHRIILGTVIALGLGTSALAQNASSNAPASSMPSSSNAPYSPAAVTPDALKRHLTRGAEIHDASGKVVATVTTTKEDGSILIRESSMGAGPAPSIDRVLPASAVSWTNGKLVTSLSAEAIRKLPNG